MSNEEDRKGRHTSFDGVSAAIPKTDKKMKLALYLYDEINESYMHLYEYKDLEELLSNIQDFKGKVYNMYGTRK